MCDCIKKTEQKDQVSAYPVRGIPVSMIRGIQGRTTEDQDLFNAMIKTMSDVGKKALDK